MDKGVDSAECEDFGLVEEEDDAVVVVTASTQSSSLEAALSTQPPPAFRARSRRRTEELNYSPPAFNISGVERIAGSRGDDVGSVVTETGESKLSVGIISRHSDWPAAWTVTNEGRAAVLEWIE